MSLLENLLSSIAANGRSLVDGLGPTVDQATNNATPTSPFDAAGSGRLSDEDWTRSQAIIADCYQLISILMPSTLKVFQDALAVTTTASLGIASHFGLADVIEKSGGQSTISHLAAAVNTDEAKLSMGGGPASRRVL